jgi:hypothetical protein
MMESTYSPSYEGGIGLCPRLAPGKNRRPYPKITKAKKG